MNKRLFAKLLGIICWCALPFLALAQPSTFDCNKAEGSVEKLVCSDASLIALDQKLAEVYREAVAKATDSPAHELLAEQRGWIKGRNECWKADGQQTWITASWTVNTVKDCVSAQYKIRIAQLQSVWRLLPPKTVFFVCQNNPANEVVAHFFATDPATIQLERGDRTVTLWQIDDKELAKYEGQNVSLTHIGATLQIDWLNIYTGQTDKLECNAR